MRNDFSTQDMIGEYADAAKRIHASSRFRSETLRKIRLQAASQQDTAQPDVQEDFSADDAFDITVSNTDSAPTKIKKSSQKQRFRSLLGVAASIALVGGTAAFLYRKASSDDLKNPAESGSVSTTSAAMQDTDNSIPLSPSADPVLSYQQKKRDIVKFFSELESGILSDIYSALNPPSLHSAETLDDAKLTLTRNRSGYMSLAARMDELETALCSCGDVAIYDVRSNTDGTVQMYIANGTDEDVTISRGYKISNAKTGVPCSSGSVRVKSADTKIPSHTTATFDLEGCEPFEEGVGYCVTIFDGGYRLSTADSGVREFTFVYYGDDKAQNMVKAIMDMQESDPFAYDFSVNTEAIAKQPSLADVQAYLQTHHNVEKFLEDYEPVYTFSSQLWGFSPYQTEIGPTTRRIWILESNNHSYIEDLNGEYHLIQPGITELPNQ